MTRQPRRRGCWPAAAKQALLRKSPCNDASAFGRCWAGRCLYWGDGLAVGRWGEPRCVRSARCSESCRSGGQSAWLMPHFRLRGWSRRSFTKSIPRRLPIRAAMGSRFARNHAEAAVSSRPRNNRHLAESVLRVAIRGRGIRPGRFLQSRATVQNQRRLTRTMRRGPAHGGIRVMLDLVAGHTSVQHPWFRESQRFERNRYADALTSIAPDTWSACAAKARRITAAIILGFVVFRTLDESTSRHRLLGSVIWLPASCPA